MRIRVAAALSVVAVVLLFATPLTLTPSLMALAALLLAYDRNLLKEPDHEHRSNQRSADRAHHHR